MAFDPSAQEDARNRLRSAEDWMVGWARSASNNQYRDDVSKEDVAELALGKLKTQGSQVCVDFISRWRSPQFVFEVGQLVASRLVERSDLPQLNELLATSRSNKYLQLAITGISLQRYVRLDLESAKSVATMLKRHRKKIVLGNDWDYSNAALWAICGAIMASIRCGSLSHTRAAEILDLYLDPKTPSSIARSTAGATDSLLLAWALRAYLDGRKLTTADVAGKELMAEINGKSHTSTQDGREYRDDIIPLFPWVAAWVRVLCDPEANGADELRSLVQNLPKGRHRSEYSPNRLINMATKIAAAIASVSGTSKSDVILRSWLEDVSSVVWAGSSCTAIRLLSSKTGWDTTLFALARKVEQQADQTPEDAQFRVDILLDLSRALHSFSLEESEHYFAEALSISENIGDEAHARWEATLAVARRASSDNPDDERAFYLARLAEAYSPYLGDGFYAPGTIEVIAGLSMRATLSIVSRWRDRRFGDFGNAVASLLDAARTSGFLDFSSKTALSVFSDRTMLSELEFVGSEEDDEIAEAWRALRPDLARLRGESVREAVPDGPGFEAHDRNFDSVENEAQSRAKQDSARAMLGTMALTSPEELFVAFEYVQNERYVSRDAIPQLAFALPEREWARVVRSYAALASLSIYDFRSLFVHVASLPAGPRAFNDALADLVRVIAVRFSEQIVSSRWESLPWADIEKMTGIGRQEIMATALRECGSLTEFLDPASSYGLLENLTSELSQNEATQLFDHVERHSRYLIDEEGAEFEWRQELQPPSNVPGSVAGLVWAALGDIDEAIRWRAAHAVRLLVRVAGNRELVYLSELARSGPPTAFTDSRFVFYLDDATLWLVLALDRAASATPAGIAAFVPLLEQLVIEDKHHALIERHASSALGKLARGKEFVSTQSTVEPGAERSPLPAPLVIDYADRHQESRSDYEESGANYGFRYDFRKEWAAPLARCFGADPFEVERRVSSRIAVRWEDRFRGAHEEDERWAAGVFRQGETYSSRSESPRIHTLDEYLTFHGLLRTAGEMREGMSPYQDPESEADDYARWVEQKDLTRLDGGWLADRRDPVPPREVALSPSDFDKRTWRWSVSPSDLISRIDATNEDFIVWERSSIIERDRSQKVSVRSALVNPDRGPALLAAMQTAPSRMDFRIPAAGLGHDLRVDGFDLTGWIEEGGREPALDISDSFGGGVGFPPARPSMDFQQTANISPDRDLRFWNDADLVLQATTTSWSNLHKERERPHLGSSGERFRVASGLMDSVLTRVGMDLIVEVAIGRSTFDHSGRNDDPVYEIGYLDDYFKLFLYSPGRGWSDLRGRASFR